MVLLISREVIIINAITYIPNCTVSSRPCDTGTHYHNVEPEQNWAEHHQSLVSDYVGNRIGTNRYCLSLDY